MWYTMYVIKRKENKKTMTVRHIKDVNYPIEINDAWEGEIYLTIDQAKELIKDIQEIIKNIEKTP